MIKHKEKAPYVLHWAVLSGGFLFLAFDETISVHERLIEPVRAMLGEVDLGILYFAWVAPAAIMIAALFVFFLRFLLSLPRNVAFWFIVSAALYLGAAVGLELAEGKHVEIFGKGNFIYMALATTEETLEMVGIVVFIGVLMKYIGKIANDLHFSVGTLKPDSRMQSTRSGRHDRSDDTRPSVGAVARFDERENNYGTDD